MSLEEVISKAVALEKKYDWVGAIGFYEHVLSTVEEKDYMKKGEVQEKIGHGFHRGAFQAESQ